MCHTLSLVFILSVSFSLQKFKLNIANSVVSQENSSLLSMNTTDFLNLFELGEDSSSSKKGDSAAESGGGSLKNILDNLPELWEEDQYHNEYNIDSFVNSLHTAS